MKFLKRSARSARRAPSPAASRNRAGLVVEPLEERSLLAAGMLDPTFGVGGLMSTDFGFRTVVVDAAVQPDGKIVVAGTAFPDSATGNDARILLARYNADGTLDDGSATDSTSGDHFGDHLLYDTLGYFQIDLGSGFGHAYAAAVALQADGRIVVAGTLGDESRAFVVVRVNADGTPDDGYPHDRTEDDVFGRYGRAELQFGGEFNDAKAVVVQPDGKIVVAGTASFGGSPTQTAFAIARLNPDGSLDAGESDVFGDGFGEDGVRLIAFDALPGVHNADLTDIALQPDGRIVLVGHADDDTGHTGFALARLHDSGDTDVSFGTNGVVLHDVSPGDDSATSVALQRDGKIVVGGYVDNQRSFVLSRYEPRGLVDGSFGTGGAVITDIGPDGDALFDLLVPDDGSIVAAGMTRNRAAESFGDFALARYNSTGQLDATFGTADPSDPSRHTGVVVTDFGASPFDLINDEAHTVILTPLGLVLAGTTRFNVDGTLHSGVALARYEAASDRAQRTFRPTGEGARSFGFSLAADGDVLAVGDPEAQSHVINLGIGTVGRAYTFYLTTGAAGTDLRPPTPTFDPSGLEPYEPPLYGLSVAVIGGTVAVGAPGSGYVDFRDAATAAHLGHSTLDDSTEKLTDYGTALAAVDRDPIPGLDGFVIGAPESLSNPLPDRQFGHVEYLDLPPAGPPPADDPRWDFRWVHPRLTDFPLPGDQEMGDYYGEAVAGLPDKVLVGDSLAARAYVQAASDGTVLLTLAPPAEGPGTYFGSAVAGYGADLLVGAPGDDGAVYLFDGTTGELVRTFANPFPDPQDRFGFSVTSLGNYVLIGAPNDDTLGTDAGAVYIFDGLTGNLVRTVLSSEPRDFANFGFALCAVGENSFAVGAPSLLSISDPGAVYVLDIGLPVGALRSGAAVSGVIRGTIWDDRNQDGQQDINTERGLAGQVVFLDKDGNGSRGPDELLVQTGLDGTYQFSVRGPAEYRVTYQPPVGRAPTAPLGTDSLRFAVTANLDIQVNGHQSEGTADLNGDGRPDVFSVDSYGLLVHFNDPFSQLGVPPSGDIHVSRGFSKLVPADMNGDGLLDLVLGHDTTLSADGALSILLNDVADPGTFSFYGQADRFGLELEGLTVADFNGDGRMDIAFAQLDIEDGISVVRVLLQDPTQPARFLDAVSCSVPLGVHTMVAADLNNDGLIDMAVGHKAIDPSAPASFSILLNTPAAPGTLSLERTYREFSLYPRSIAAGDLNGDGLVDLAMVSSLFADVEVVLNLPAAPGTFGRAQPFGSRWHDEVAVTDYDGDGRLDVLALSRGEGVGLLRQNPAAPGSFLQGVELFSGAAESVPIVDFDQDGRLDFLYHRAGPSGLQFIDVLTTQHAYQVSHTVTVSAGQPTVTANFGTWLDYDGDGIGDEVEKVAPNNGDGNADGIPDFKQLHVATLESDDGSRITVVAPVGTWLADASNNPPGMGGKPSEPPNTTFPIGVFGFAVKGVVSGGAADVTFIFHDAEVAASTYLKFGPSATDATPHWYDFLADGSAGALGATLFDDDNDGLINRLVLHLRDGGAGDYDGIANGVIVDPGGPALRQEQDADRLYVTSLYHDVLGREPDPAGLEFWARAFQQRVSRLEVARGIWESSEQRGIQVDQLYATYLHRTADPNGREFWVQAMLSGVSDTDVAVGFLTSIEYALQHATTTSFIDGLYADILRRSADPLGLAHWPGVTQGAGGRPATAQGILTSEEEHRRTLDRYFATFLGRASDPREEASWLAALQDGRLYPAQLAQQLLASDEYVGLALDGKVWPVA